MNADYDVVVLSEAQSTPQWSQPGEKDVNEPGSVPARYRGTATDKRDMSVMGRKQVLRVGLTAL